VENLIILVTPYPHLPVPVSVSKLKSINCFLCIVTIAAVLVAIGLHPSFDSSLADMLMFLEKQCIPADWGLRKGTMADALIAFISWSTTYLFIRRLWNPETSPMAFERFSADAFYGGLAAAAASIVKSVLYASLVKS